MKLFTLVSFFAAAVSFAAPPSALNKAEGVCTFGEYTLKLYKMTPLRVPARPGSGEATIYKIVTIEKASRLEGALVAKFQPDNGPSGSDPAYLYTAQGFSLHVSLTLPPGVSRYVSYLTAKKGSLNVANEQGSCEFALAADLE